MESLSLKDQQSSDDVTSRFDRHRSRAWTPRLPTPDDTSRSSFDDRETSSGSGRMQNQDLPSRPQLERNHSHTDSYFHKTKLDSCNRDEPAPNSPPYDASDVERPSLPPLKMVLGDNMASPPRTPKTLPTPLQLEPREPTYHVDAFKPLALYPNKKQRTEAVERAPHHHATNSFATPTSAGGERSLSARQVVPFTDPTPMRIPFSPTGRPVQRPDTLTDNRGFSTRAHPDQSMQLAMERESRSNGVAPTHLPQLHDSRAVQPPHSLKRAWTDAIAPPDFDRRPQPHSPDRYYARKNDDVQYSQYGEAQYVQMQAPSHDYPYLPPAQGDFRRSQGSAPYGRAEHHALAIRPDYGHGAYQNDQMVEGFASGRYEYYYPKARKRSNLPKHSTEIMRAWFDQNISNPYPSEDQKAIFANATGISLTQVSNWFINHRRRCPELRDKRAERRKI